jgi:hypothetical protein
MAHMTDKYGTEVYDETDEYDSRHGDPAKGKDHVCVDLSQTANKPPAQYMPIKVTQSR